MKKYRYTIIGVVITMILAFFLTFDAYAEEGNSESNNNKCENGETQNIEERYNLTLEKIRDNQYKISMKGDKADLDDAAFKVVGTTTYEGYTGNVGEITQGIDTIPEIKKDQVAYFNAKPRSTDDGSILAVEVKLVKGTSKNSDCDYYGTLIIKDYGNSVITPITGGANSKTNKKSIYHNGSICYNFYNGIWNSSQFVGISQNDFNEYNYKAVAGKKINDKSIQTIYDSTLVYCKLSQISAGAEYTDEELVNMISNAITYVKTQTKVVGGGNKTFATLFNEIRTNAINSGNNKSGKTAEDKGITCDWKLTADSGDSSDYYKNKKYYYKSETEAPISVTYEYNYAPGDTQTSKSQEVCKRTCSEAVKVEYGPPIASKAGLCFEYKVKVTSYVECTSNIVSEPPEMSGGACSPVPFCHEKNWRWEGHQAGPTEEFDSCIQECDGGKYTSKCSTKCYKKVYKNSKLKLAVDYTTSPQQIGLDIDSCIASSPDGGCYYWSGDQIMWKSKYQTGDWTNDAKALGRWYRVVGWNISDVGSGLKYDVSSNGIKTEKKLNSSTGHCQDVCYWQTDVCKKGMYLNPQSILDDYKENSKRYQAAVNKCKAAATCSSTTAEFTISVKYDEKDSKGNIDYEKKIEFPYSPATPDNANPPDKISALGYPEKGKVSERENTSSNKNSTILSYDGCYSAEDEKNWYLTEWSFPGTYIHNKTGEISYTPPKDNSGWYYDNQKFCMPLNAQSVNTKWWEWYKISNKKFKDDGGCYTADQIANEINKGKSGTSNGYNIEASAKNFGYFGWNFDIKCFYALRNETCNLENKEVCCPPPPTTTGLDYTIRSIDRDNLFPNEKTEGVVDETKREIGFNWTEKAISLKNSEYSVNPVKLRKYIQDNAATLYSDASNLDYQFYLTPTILQRIRAYNETTDYGTFNGTSDEKNGIHVYSSNLFRSTVAPSAEGVKANIINDDGVVIKTGTIGVNNENYTEFGG